MPPREDPRHAEHIERLQDEGPVRSVLVGDHYLVLDRDEASGGWIIVFPNMPLDDAAGVTSREILIHGTQEDAEMAFDLAVEDARDKMDAHAIYHEVREFVAEILELEATDERVPESLEDEALVN